MQRTKYAAPIGKILNFIKKEKTGILPGELVESREKLIHVIPGESTQSIVLEIYKKNILFFMSTALQQGLDELVHEVGLSRPPRPYDRKDVLKIFGIHGVPITGHQRGNFSLFQPFGYNGEQDIFSDIVYHGKQINVLLFTCQPLICSPPNREKLLS